MRGGFMVRTISQCLRPAEWPTTDWQPENTNKERFFYDGNGWARWKTLDWILFGCGFGPSHSIFLFYEATQRVGQRQAESQTFSTRLDVKTTWGEGKCGGWNWSIKKNPKKQKYTVFVMSALLHRKLDFTLRVSHSHMSRWQGEYSQTDTYMELSDGVRLGGCNRCRTHDCHVTRHKTIFASTHPTLFFTLTELALALTWASA